MLALSKRTQVAVEALQTGLRTMQEEVDAFQVFLAETDKELTDWPVDRDGMMEGYGVTVEQVRGLGDLCAKVGDLLAQNADNAALLKRKSPGDVAALAAAAELGGMR
jgi:hypothetical protein